MKPSFTMVAVCWLWISFAAQASIIDYWRFEEGTGGTAVDSVGGINGDLYNVPSVQWSTVVPATSIPLTGESNRGSLAFGGAGMLDITTPQTMNLGTSFTIEFFFNPEEPVLSSPMFALSNGPFLWGALVDEYDSTNHFIGFFFGAEAAQTPNLNIALNEWHHFALVKTPGYFSVFIDGALQGESSLPSSTDGSYIFGGSPETGDRSIGNGFRGYIDEFRISDTALTPDQFLNAVPEPGVLGLLALGGSAIYSARRRYKYHANSKLR